MVEPGSNAPSEVGDQDKPVGRPRIVGISGRRRRLMSDPSDTAQGCRDRADADMVRSKGDIPINARMVLEVSARHWRARADLLERLERSFAERPFDETAR